jgi:hypothetical protein
VQAALDIVRATTTIDEEEADATQEWEPE